MIRLSAIVCFTLYWMFLPQGKLLAAELSKKPDSWFLSDEGRQTMANILSWQSDHGDWPKNTDTTTKVFSGDRSKLQGTLMVCPNTILTRSVVNVEMVMHGTETGAIAWPKSMRSGLVLTLEASVNNPGDSVAERDQSRNTDSNGIA